MRLSSFIRSHSVFRRLGLRAWVGAAALSVSMSAAATDLDDWWFYVRNDFWHQIDPLIKQGADPNRVDPEGQPTLVEAVRSKAWKTYEGLLKQPGIDLEAVNRDGETALMLLSVLGETTRVRQLLDRGAQVDKLGWTPLHYAASRGQIDVAQLLIRRKAIINAPSPDGTTPLMMAALSKNERMVQVLLDAGAEPTTRNLSRLNAADWARSAQAARLAKKLDDVIARREQSRARAPAGVKSRQSAPAVAPAAAQVPPPEVSRQGAMPVTPSAAQAQAVPPAPHPSAATPQAEGGVRGVRLGAEY